MAPNLTSDSSFCPRASGLTRGDRVALVMENRPEYVITWLGLTKVGVEIALINYNLVGRGLMHCITVSNAKVVVFGTEVAQVSLTAFAAITGEAHCFQLAPSLLSPVPSPTRMSAQWLQTLLLAVWLCTTKARAWLHLVRP